MPPIPRFGHPSFLAALSFVAGLSAAPIPIVPLKDFLGICGHTVQFHLERYAGVVSVVRDYHPVAWDLADYTANPAPLPFAKNKVSWEHI